MPPLMARKALRADLAELRRRSTAGRLVQEALDRLPTPAPGPVEPAAAREADGLVWRLGALFRVVRWDWAEFRRAFVRGALLPWRPGSEVREDALALRVRSDHCPMLERGRADPRACQACQAFLARAVHLASGGEAGPVAFEACQARGDPFCSLLVPRREEVRTPMQLEAALARQWQEVAP